MYIGGSMVEGWDETGWVFRGDAKLAHSAVWLGVFVEGRDFCFGGTPNWRIAQFGWMCLWKDGTFVLRGRGIGA